mmetsp:Transcript_16656/g.21622  ORF Transcript_16656/g.21622 Transcript_16656/m.21622 type:complete len:585 (+) Transcript_16656:161-1915(+)
MKYSEVENSDNEIVDPTRNNRSIIKPDENTNWWTEAKYQMSFSLPIMVQTCSQQTMMLTDLIFIGRLGSNELSIIGISGILWNIMWYWLLGVASALDTLGSQALGSGNDAGLRSWTLVSIIISLLICIPMLLILIFLSGPFAQYGLGSDPETASEVGNFCSLLGLGLIPGAITQSLQKYLTIRGIVAPVGGCALITLFINIIFNQLFIHGMGTYWSGMGMLGSPIATSTSRLTQLLMLLLYCHLYPQYVHGDDPNAAAAWNDPWKIWQSIYRPSTPPLPRSSSSSSSSLLTDSSTKGQAALMTYCRLGAEGGVMLVSEAMSFDVTCIYAALLGKLPLDAHTVLLNLCGWTYLSGPLAFGIAASVRVGTELGANRPKAARAASSVAFFFGVGWMMIMAALLYTFRKEFATIIVGDGDGKGPPSDEVINLVCQLAFYAALFQVFDGLLGIAGGVLRGCGQQGFVAKVNIATLWGVGVIGGFVFTFIMNFGIFGVWMGLASGVAAGGLATSIGVYNIDWKKEVNRALDVSTLAGSPFQSQRGYCPSPVVKIQIQPSFSNSPSSGDQVASNSLSSSYQTFELPARMDL